jgi:putative methyltransferase (TIGR04325 family)
VNPGLKRWIADWVPPHLRHLLRGKTADGAVRYSGDFRTWDEARRHSLGYDAPAIVERVKQAMLKVQRGEAAYERDSVLFTRVEHSYPLLAGLLRAALANGGRLKVVDIGGSLGSTYFQCRPVLEGATSVRWCVVEQPIFAACGREHFESEQLRFFDNLETCLADELPDVALLSSVLPYVEAPHALLETVARAVPRVIIDRTPLWSALPDRLTVQSVPASIYGFPTSYPAWILNRERLLDHFGHRFRIVFEFDALAGRVDVDGTPANDTGFLLERTSPST